MFGGCCIRGSGCTSKTNSKPHQPQFHFSVNWRTQEAFYALFLSIFLFFFWLWSRLWSNFYTKFSEEYSYFRILHRSNAFLKAVLPTFHNTGYLQDMCNISCRKLRGCQLICTFRTSWHIRLLGLFRCQVRLVFWPTQNLDPLIS